MRESPHGRNGVAVGAKIYRREHCVDQGPHRYLGKPIQPAQLKEPLGNNGIRRWVRAMHYPNRLHSQRSSSSA